VLLIEDHKNVAEVIFDYFEDSEFELDYAATGTRGLDLASSNNYDCIVLDLMLPGINGLDICKSLRGSGDDTPIIMLTARDTDEDMLLGFDTGADDYLIKPFKVELLEARLISLTRRYSGGGFKTEYIQGELKLNKATYQVWRSGDEIKLSPSCFKILHILIERYPEVVTREEIEMRLWQDELPMNDLLRKHIYQLRKKVDGAYEKELIETIPKIGYKLNL
jgi:DNA-binding response OmpR family regulator